MKPKDKLIGWFAVLLLIASAAVANSSICHTHEPCSIPGTCQCSVIPSAAFERAFYIDLMLQKGHTYKCNFSASLPTPLDLGGSTIPPGLIYKCISCSYLDNAEIIFDATNMKALEDIAKIRFIIGTSDVPTDISVTCRYNDVKPN